MMRFVGTIFVIALALAAIYFFFLTPERAKAQDIPHAALPNAALWLAVTPPTD